MLRALLNGLWLALAISVLLMPARAADFSALNGQTIRIVISTPAGGSNDRYARAFGAALERLLPDAAVRIQNVDGAGGTLGAREIAEAKGSLITIGLLHTGPIYKQLTASEALPYDLGKMHWIGALGANQRFLGVRKALVPFDIRNRDLAKKRLIMLTRTAGSPSHVDGLIINAITPMRMKIVTGFKEEEQDSMFLAGQADAVIASFESSHELVASGDLVPVFRFSDRHTPEALKGAVNLADIINPGTPADVLAIVQELNDTGRFLVAAPATGRETVAALRAAFAQVVAEPGYIQAIADAKLVHSPVAGSEIEATFGKLFQPGNNVGKALKVYLGCGQDISDEKIDDCE
jgi:tripartite-type tricarboxylate transporter receptor subunit TctC